MRQPHRQSRRAILPRRVQTQVLGANVRQATAVGEEGGVGADVGDAGAEGTKVGVAADEVRLVEPLEGLPEEGVGRTGLLMGVGVLGDPDLGVGPSIGMLLVVYGAGEW